MLTELNENPACIECGLCREVCPVFTVTRDETVAPRGRAMLAAASMAAAGTDSPTYYQCTLCRACRIACPVGRDPEGELLRARLVASDVQTEANREMIANIRRYGNPFGALQPGEIPKKLTCC